MFATPGFQLALQGLIVEGSLQLPVIREVRNSPEPDSVLIIGTRITR